MDTEKRLKPEDMPPGVTVSLGYDDRGRCYLFDHFRYGHLGKLIVIDLFPNTLLNAEIVNRREYESQFDYDERETIFNKAIMTISDAVNKSSRKKNP